MTSPVPAGNSLDGRREQMFPVLTADQMLRAHAFGTQNRFEDGAIVWEQGQQNVPFMIVLEGKVEVVHPADGKEELVVVHERGHFTGETNSLNQRRSLVRAKALGSVRVLAIEGEQLQALVQTDTELSDIVLRAFILRRMALLSSGHGDALVIGSRDSAASLRLHAFFSRNGQPFRWLDVDSDPDVQKLLTQFHVGREDIPILICRGERVLRNPSDAEVSECLGLNAAIDLEAVRDVVVCGAGPGGLAAAVYAASEGLDVLVLESGSPGGQAASSSKIENYFGFPTGISGQALLARGLVQAEKFGANVAVTRGATSIGVKDGLIHIELAGGGVVRTRAVVVATGAEYRKLALPNLAQFEGAGIYYSATSVEAIHCSAEEVVVVGGGNSAGQAAMFLSKGSSHVHMLIRGNDLASSMSRYLTRRIEGTHNITLHRRTQIVALEGSTHLDALTWKGESGETQRRPIRHVFSMAGAKPNTEWLRGCVALDEQGFVLTGADLTQPVLVDAKWSEERAPYQFESSVPRVFAVGDVRALSVKRVASAVGEGSVCIQLVHKALL